MRRVGKDLVPHPLQPVRDLVARPRDRRLDDLRRASGFDTDSLREVLEAAGRWSDEGFTDDDVAYVERLAAMSRHVPFDLLVRDARVRHRAMATLVVNTLASVRDLADIAGAIRDGADIEELGRLIAGVGEELLPHVGALLVSDYHATLWRLLETEVVAASAADPLADIELAVGFVDLVGFTSLSAAIDPDGLHEVLRGFEDLVHDVVGDASEVLVAKFLGDGALLVSGRVTEMAEVLLAIVDASAPELSDVPRRAGLAHGDVFVRDGDYFGPVVNLAARLTDVARPGSVIAPAALTDQLDPERSTWSRMPTPRLKGIGRTEAVRLRRRSD